MTAEAERKAGFARDSSRVGFNVAALIVARFAGLALTLVQNGIIVRAIGLEGYGQYGFALGYASLFTVFATLGIQRLLVRELARDRAAAWTGVWTATATILGLCLVVMAAIAGSIALWEPNPVTRAAVVYAALSVVFLWAVQQPFESLLTAWERLGLVSVVYIAAAVLKLVSVTVAVFYVEPTSASAHAAIAAANLCSLGLCVGFAVRVAGWERPHFRFGLAGRQIRESVPFTVAMLFSLIYFKSDMSLLNYLRGDAATGIYTPPQRIMEPLLMIAGLWGTAVFPALCRLSHVDADHYGRMKAKSLRLALLAAFPMAAGVALLARPIIQILTGDLAAFEESIVILQILAVTLPLFYFNGVVQEFFYSAHRNWFVVGSYAAASAVSVAGNLWAIPRFGVPGLAWVAVASNGSVTLLFAAGLWRELRGARMAGLLVRTAAACAVMGVTAWLFARWSLVAGVTAGALLYVVMQMVLRTLNADERDMLGHIGGALRVRRTR